MAQYSIENPEINTVQRLNSYNAFWKWNQRHTPDLAVHFFLPSSTQLDPQTHWGAERSSSVWLWARPRPPADRYWIYRSSPACPSTRSRLEGRSQLLWNTQTEPMRWCWRMWTASLESKRKKLKPSLEKKRMPIITLWIIVSNFIIPDHTWLLAANVAFFLHGIA